MFSAPDLIAFFTATFILAITPGNDVIFITSQSLGSGLRGGFAATLGVSFGILFHLLALTLGLSELILHYPWVFNVIKIGGILYLLFLAFKAFKNASSSFPVEGAPMLPFRKIFFRGTFTNLTNPKVALFFLAFIPQFLDPTSSKIATQILFLGLSFLGIGTFTNFLYALLFGTVSKKLRNNQKFTKIVGKLTGVIFIGLAVKLWIL